MDDYEIDAFVLVQQLNKARRTYPRNEDTETWMMEKIYELRDKSRTYAPLGEIRGSVAPLRYKAGSHRRPVTNKEN